MASSSASSRRLKHSSTRRKGPGPPGGRRPGRSARSAGHGLREVPLREQKAKLARKHQSQIHVKEIKLRPKIGIHDYETKKGHVLRFLGQRAKVKVTIMSPREETLHPERGRDLLSASPRTKPSWARSKPSRRWTDGTWSWCSRRRRPQARNGRPTTRNPKSRAQPGAGNAKAEEFEFREKRFKVTGTGKILRRHAMQSHNLEGKSAKRKRDFARDEAVHPAVREAQLLGRGSGCHA